MFSIQSSLPRLRSPSCGTIKRCRQVRWASVKHRRGEVGRPPQAKAHWTPEKLAIDDGYPLTTALNDKIHPAKQPKVSKSGKKVSPKDKSAGHHDAPGVFVRTQIVSPELCDDILSYVGPSLAAHKGCDILDINPGACLWSQKLHQYLQPRSHVLLEPNYDTFKDFIDPLLQAPKSKYKLVDKDPRTLDSYRQIVDEGVFPHQTRVDRSDPAAPALNHTLLVTGSLAWDPRLPGLGFDSMAKQLFNHFATAAWSHDLFHAYGPVRTLLWVPNDDFNPVIAHGINGMQKANRHLEMILELNLVVRAERKGRASGKQANTREPGLEIESLIRALKAGETNGLELPPHRRDFTYDVAKHVNAIYGGTVVTRSKSMQEYLHDVQRKGTIPIGLVGDTVIANIEREMELKQMYPGLNFDANAAEAGRPRSETQFRDISPAKWKEITNFKKVRSSIMNIIRNKEKVEEVVDVGESLYLHEIKALSLPEGPEYDALLKRIDELDKDFEEKTANLDPYYRNAASLWTDERLSLRHPPEPRIQWDQRPFEPMIMHEKEVWPRNRLALVLATPKPKPQGSSADWAEWMQDFIYGLYNDPALPVAAALDTMQHGLSDIVKDCASLRDPKVGGRLQTKHIRVRMLTMAMLNELVQVYRDWPFKEPGSDHNKYFRLKSQGFGVARGLS